MAGISHASFQQKNYLMVYHILHAFFTQPAPFTHRVWRLTDRDAPAARAHLHRTF